MDRWFDGVYLVGRYNYLQTGVWLLAHGGEAAVLEFPPTSLTGFAHGSDPAADAARAARELGVRADHLAWRDYDHHFRHRLSANAGRYWQEGYGSAWIPSLSYRHEWQWAMGRVLSYGISWARPVYDGARETRYGFDAELRWGE